MFLLINDPRSTWNGTDIVKHRHIGVNGICMNLLMKSIKLLDFIVHARGETSRWEVDTHKGHQLQTQIVAPIILQKVTR